MKQKKKIILITCRDMKKINDRNDNKTDNLQSYKTDRQISNNYLTIYNLKFSNSEKNILPKYESKKNSIGLPKMRTNYKTKDNYKSSKLNIKEKEIKTFFRNKSSNELFIKKNVFKTKKINRKTVKIPFSTKKLKNNKKILIESISIPGTKLEKEKINQDSYMILPNKLISENKESQSSILKIFGIFDGHGEFGDIISKEVKNYFIEYFSKFNFNSNDNYEKICNNNYKEIYSIFNQIDKKLHKKYYLKNTCYNSGTTANIIILFKHKIIHNF